MEHVELAHAVGLQKLRERPGQRPIILPQRRTSALQTDIERLRDSEETIVRKCSRAISRIQQSKHGGGIAGVAIGTERAFSDEG